MLGKQTLILRLTCKILFFLYEQKNFKEALKEGVFSLTAARDSYKEICGNNGVNYDLMMKYTRFQTIALTPLTPHICEYIWRELLGNTSTITNQLWPVIHEQTENERKNIQALDFLQSTARGLRLKLRTHQQGIQKKIAKGITKGTEQPDAVNLYVSESVPAWQAICLKICMQLIEQKNDGSWPDMKEISQLLKKENEIKKYMKKAIGDTFGLTGWDYSCQTKIGDISSKFRCL